MSIIPWKSGSSVPVGRLSSGRGTGIFSLQEEVNRLFDEFFGGAGRIPALFEDGRPAMMASPAVDVYETEKGYKIKAELPGMAAENVEVTCGEGYIVLKGEKKSESEEKGENYIRRETSCGAFQRNIPMPEIADTAAAEASFKNGVLTILVPKKEAALRQEKKIAVKSAA